MNPKNYKHIQVTCPECKGTEILTDPEHEVTYCTHCGLVLKENIIFKITIAIQEDKIEEKRLRNLWLRKRENKKKSSLKKNKFFHQ